MSDIYQNDEYWNIGLSDDVYKIIMQNENRLNSIINYDNDFLLNYFGFKVISYFFTSFTFLITCLIFLEFNTIFFS